MLHIAILLSFENELGYSEDIGEANMAGVVPRGRGSGLLRIRRSLESDSKGHLRTDIRDVPALTRSDRHLVKRCGLWPRNGSQGFSLSVLSTGGWLILRETIAESHQSPIEPRTNSRGCRILRDLCEGCARQPRHRVPLPIALLSTLNSKRSTSSH